MRRTLIAGGLCLLVVVLLALAALVQDVEPVVLTPPPGIPPAGSTSEALNGFLYGRVVTETGATYEGRLRWGGDQEAFWGDYFNGTKATNPWAGDVPPERLKKLNSVEIFGIEIARRDAQSDLARPFLARFGDIDSIEPLGSDLRVKLKSGTLFHLDRFGADDVADGVRIWDGQHGVVDLDEWQIRSVEFLPTGRLGPLPARLHGTVRTQLGEEFTGFVQWDRQDSAGSDELAGYTSGGKLSLRFDALRSIRRISSDSSLLTLVDGREIELSDTRKVGRGNRGIYVDDRRYGRVLVSWFAFERIDFTPGGSGPAYGDFPPGIPIKGSVTTRAGRRLVGRLVYDLDESETTETLDAPSHDVNYNIPFGLIASIEPVDREEGNTRWARVTLHSGEELQLERSGDLAEANLGLLIFSDDSKPPEFVSWVDVERIELERPEAMYPPFGEHQTPKRGTS